MTLKVFITLMITIIFFIFAYIVVKGKGDKFIAEAFCCMLPVLENNNGTIAGSTVVLFGFSLVVVVLANTWARKKEIGIQWTFFALQ